MVQIWRGISQRDNYIIPADEDAYFDLRFLLPKNFLSGREANAMSKASYLFKEDLFKKDFNEFLDFYHKQTGKMCGEFKMGFRESAMLGISPS